MRRQPGASSQQRDWCCGATVIQGGVSAHFAMAIGQRDRNGQPSSDAAMEPISPDTDGRSGRVVGSGRGIAASSARV